MCITQGGRISMRRSSSSRREAALVAKQHPVSSLYLCRLSCSSSKAIHWVIDFASLIGLSKYYYVVIFYMQFSLVLSLTLVITISLFSLTQEHKICDENSLYVTPGNQWTFISAVCIYINFFLLCGLSDVNYAIGLA